MADLALRPGCLRGAIGKDMCRNVMLTLTSLVVALLLAEFVLRAIDYQNPSFYQYDLELGSVLRPGAEGLWTKEGKAYVRINSDGLRDEEHMLAKPDGVFRIAVLGDSYMEGLQLPIENLAWKVMERRLNSTCFPIGDYKRVEVINFGVSGYGTGRELLMLRKKVWRYEPDMIILAFLTGNDIRDNSKQLNQIEYIPYFYLDEKGKLHLDGSYLQSTAFAFRGGRIGQMVGAVINDVRLLQLLNEIRQSWHQRQTAKKMGQVASKIARGHELGLDDMIYKPPAGTAWHKAWQITEALLKQMKREAEAQDAQFLVVTLSNGIQVHPDRQVRIAFAQRLGVQDLFYPENRIRSFGEKHNIDVLALAPLLQRVAEEEQIFLHGFKSSGLGSGHWNANGHRIAGELMAERVCSKLIDY